MSHRMYLYNLAEVPGEKESTTEEGLSAVLATYGETGGGVCMMMEWKYEFPMLLHPLFTGDISIHPPVYNGHEGGLYAPAAPGIAALKSFYAFIERHQDKLVDNIPAFTTAKQQLFAFLDEKAIYPYFHLDAWDVFNMSDESHLEQAKEQATLIRKNNAIFQQAVAEDNPALLDTCPEFHTGHYLKDFRTMLNTPGYDFGWAVIQSGQFDDPDQQIVFNTDGLSGLKDKDGKILAPAIYDEIYEFPYGEDLAIVVKAGKFGYINRAGKEQIPCTFDDAWDVEEGLADVKQNGAYGVINTMGIFVIPAIYEDGHRLTAQYWALSRENSWAVADSNGNILLDFMPAHDITIAEEYNAPYFKVEMDNGEVFAYTQLFKPMAALPVKTVQALPDYSGSHPERTLYAVTLQQGGTGLVNATGETLLPFEYSEMIPMHRFNGFIVKTETGTGYYTADKGWALPCEYEQLWEPDNYNSADDPWLMVRQQGKTGLFTTGKKYDWLFSIKYDDIKWLNDNYFACKQKGKWGLAQPNDSLLTPPLFESMNAKMGMLQSGKALGFEKNGIMLMDNEGNMRALTPTEAYRELEDYPQMYFTRTEIKKLKQLSESVREAETLYDQAMDARLKGKYQQAIQGFQKAIDLGQLDALNELGYLYETVEEFRDYEQSFHWYGKSAGKDQPYGMYNLALAYLYGHGTDVNTAKALEWFEKSAEKQHASAFRQLGEYYYLGQFTEPDLDKALGYFYQAWLLKEHVCDSIGNIYERKEDYPQALFYYNESLREGSCYAAWRLGYFYLDGTGVAADLKEAETLFLQAVEEYPEAHIELAILYMEDKTLHDPAKAKTHIEAAEAAGLSNAGEYRQKYASLWDTSIWNKLFGKKGRP